jgi:hypothetical protein
MARNVYAATAADYVIDSATGRPKSGVIVTIYDARTGGSQVTDLQDMSNNAQSTVTTDATGGFRFQGPDSEDDTLWAQVAGSSTRYAVYPVASSGTPYAKSTHSHTLSQFSSGTLGLAFAPVGQVLFVSKAANGGSWPVSRPTARTDVCVLWIGDTDPGSIAVNNLDVWLDL